MSQAEPYRNIQIVEPESDDAILNPPVPENVQLLPFTVICELFEADSALCCFHVTAPSDYEAQVAAFQVALGGTRNEAQAYMLRSSYNSIVFHGHQIPSFPSCEAQFQCPHPRTVQQVFEKIELDLTRANMPAEMLAAVRNGLTQAATMSDALQAKHQRLVNRLYALADQDNENRKAARQLPGGVWPTPDRASPYKVTKINI